MSILESIASPVQSWLHDVGLVDAAPALQAGFLYSVLGTLIALYVWVRLTSNGELSGIIQLWSRTKQLEKQSIQLASENDQLRQHLLGLYDYLIQFEKKSVGVSTEQPALLSSIVSREAIAKAPDFEIVVDDYPNIRFPKRTPTIRRLSRHKLAELAGIDLHGESLASREELSARTERPTTADEEPTLGASSDLKVGSSSPRPDDRKTLHSGLQKTRSEFFTKLTALFRGKQTALADSFDALEELLISSDLGVRTTQLLLSRVREQLKDAKPVQEQQIREVLHREILSILKSATPPEILPEKRNGQPAVILVVGVNGVGKTTTIGKLAWQFRAQGKRVLVAACDTFRAAAVEQLQVWAERSGVEVIHGAENAKPTTVAYEAIHRAKNEGYDVLLVDTAGRLHTRVNLMNELSSVVKIVEREQPGAPHETILVVDASTGQNALQQAIEFNQKASLSGIVVTKLDGTSKGGIVIAIKNELNVPIRYVGVGEGVTDLRLFSAAEFTDGLFGFDSTAASDG